MATYADFLAQVRRALEEPVAGVWADASIMYWTNEIAEDFARKTKLYRDEVSVSTVVAQYNYALDSYTLEPIDAFYNGVGLMCAEVTDWPLSLDTSGTPRFYAMDGASLYLWPIPDAVGTVRLFRYRVPTPITSTSDLMPFQSAYDTALEYGVLSRAFEQTGDWQSSGEYNARYNQRILDAQNQAAMQRQARRVVNPVEVY